MQAGCEDEVRQSTERAHVASGMCLAINNRCERVCVSGEDDMLLQRPDCCIISSELSKSNKKAVMGLPLFTWAVP